MIQRMTQRLLPVAVLAGIAAVPAFSADLTIEVRGIRSGDGHLYVAVHAPGTKDTFPSGEGVAAFRQEAQVGALRFVARDLPPGQYAVNAFHDENDNGELDTNLFGIPTEGYGFANDPRTTFGPPDFEDAAVNVRDASELAVMTMRY